jgi:perosamine synthetase
LHPRKSITSGEGGIISSNNPELIAKINILKNHGVQYTDGKMQFVAAGFNYRMTDFQAALANGQLTRFAQTLQKKQELAEVYFNEIKSNKIVLPFVPEGRYHTWQTYHILIDDGLDQSTVLEQLKQLNIGSNYGAQCIPAEPYYKQQYNLDSAQLFPNALRANQKGIALPLYEKLNKTDIQYIAKQINKIC